MEITKLLIPAITKLAQGGKMTLAISIGIVNKNKDRPFTTCSGSSAKAIAIVKRSKKRELANIPDP